MDLKEDQRRKVEEIEQLHLQINQSQSTLKAQHEKFTTKYTEQVEKMYWYAYRRCKQKHAIIEDFDTDEDFVTEYEISDLETSPLGAGRPNKRVRLATTNGDQTDLVGMSAPPNVSLLEDITPCSDEVFHLPYTGNVFSPTEPIGNLDDQGNALERAKELESLLVDLDPIAHIEDLEE